MNKIYYDFEFLEGPQTKRFLGINIGQTKPTIDVISVGMVRDDGSEYYAVSKDFNLKEAWNRWDGEYHELSGFAKEQGFSPRKNFWIRENVLKPIFIELAGKENRKNIITNDFEDYLLASKDFNYKNLKSLINKYGKSKTDIAQEVFEFCTGETLSLEKVKYYKVNPQPCELYGYYSAYDHVCLAWLFGKMIDLPDGFPMYTNDLKQMFDEKQNKFRQDHEINPTKLMADLQKNGIIIVDRTELNLKKWDSYPKQENEHNALSDARWHKKLHEFLKLI